MATLYEHDMAGSPESLSYSSLYPNRPIRPLPKRRLRERLSPDVAESIQYPPSAQPTSIFYPAYSSDHVEEEYRKDSVAPAAADMKSNSSVRRFVGAANGVSNGVRSEADEYDRIPTGPGARSSRPEAIARYGRPAPKAGPSKYAALQPSSTDSSADGYDSFENTNNKKKRKIPTAGDINGAHSLGDGGTIAVSAGSSTTQLHGATSGAPISSTNGSSTNNKGISGAGRGTFGRSRNGRSPLRSLSNANNWTDRGSKNRVTPQWSSPSNENPVSGIISSAIAKAEKHSVHPGQENVSLLHQHSTANKTTPASTQFTFTCESQVPGTHWPGADPGLPPVYAPNHSLKQQVMGKSTRGPGGKAAASQAPGPDTAHEETVESAAARERQTRRQISREIKKQERERRRMAQENPPSKEDYWVCDFCVYERIFRTEPRALIRKYEEKERQMRIKTEERRKRLDRIKARSRKGKKPAKSGDKPANTQAPPHDAVGDEPPGSFDDEPNSEEDGTSEDLHEESSPIEDGPAGYDQVPVDDDGGGQDRGGGISQMILGTAEREEAIVI